MAADTAAAAAAAGASAWEATTDTAARVGDTVVGVSKQALDSVGEAAAAAGKAVNKALDFDDSEQDLAGAGEGAAQ